MGLETDIELIKSGSNGTSIFYTLIQNIIPSELFLNSWKPLWYKNQRNPSK